MLTNASNAEIEKVEGVILLYPAPHVPETIAINTLVCIIPVFYLHIWMHAWMYKYTPPHTHTQSLSLPEVYFSFNKDSPFLRIKDVLNKCFKALLS